MNNQTPISESDQVKLNIQNINDQITRLKLHKEVLLRLIDDLKQVFESKIVQPRITRNLSKIGPEDLSIDLVPIKTASKEQLKARYEWYHYEMELADVTANIEALTNLKKEYEEHRKQYFIKQGKTISDEMIYDQLKKAQDITDLNPEEKATLKGITDELLKRLNGGKDVRLELYEALKNLVLQHG
jgi:hypothetical protein